MKTNLAKTIATIAFLFGATTFCLSAALGEKNLDYPTSTEGIELIIHPKKLPIFPHSLKMEGYMQGEVELIVEIDEFGELRDHLVSATTRPEFAEEVERVIRTWNFDPPMWKGKAIPVITRIRVNFESTGAVISFDLSSGLLNRILSEDVLMKLYREQNLVGVDDLDTYPIPKVVSQPIVSKALLDENRGTQGIFSFYIDQRGKVRMPALDHVKGEVDLRLLTAVQNALMEWQFDPPTANGKPVIVYVSQPFVFNG